METIKPQYVEIIIRGHEDEVEDVAVETEISQFSVKSDEKGKYVYQVPCEWDGWIKPLRSFGNRDEVRVFQLLSEKFSYDAYFGLSLVSLEDLEVYDEKGEKVDPFSVNEGGIAKKKWVKKRMVVVKRIGEDSADSQWALVSGWRFDGRYSPPMLNFLDMKILTSGLPASFSLDDLVFKRWK